MVFGHRPLQFDDGAPAPEAIFAEAVQGAVVLSSGVSGSIYPCGETKSNELSPGRPAEFSAAYKQLCCTKRRVDCVSMSLKKASGSKP